MSSAEQVLRAGGLVPPGTEVDGDHPLDTVAARRYRHPALGDRAVVRLSPEALAAGDDLEMEVLGFDGVDDLGAVGVARRRPLGFPGWALVHDPDHARYALDVLARFKREARRARSKPGHAKTGIDEIAEELGRSVPHFLPSYYEEAGRAFLDAGNTSYAAQCFGKAREAERVHALEVDEALRRESFVEFALAGAVTIKALTAYAKELAAAYEPGEAYEHFRRLCVQRTLGGMPPWGGMARELRRLAKAAKLPAAEEDERVVAEIIESPSLVRAAAELFKAYRKPLVKLARADAAIRGAVLNLFPTEPDDAAWLELLDACGALDPLFEDGHPDAAQPAGGRAAWITRMCEHVARGWRDTNVPPALFEIVRKAAPRLIADRAPVSLCGRWGRLHVDLCDQALALGVPVADPRGRVSIDLQEWARKASEPEHGRDPVALAADPRFAALIDGALDAAMGSEPFESVARGKQGLAAAKRAWLERCIAGAAAGALPSLDATLERLERATSAATFEEFPAAYEALAAIDVAPALARCLRGGVHDELGWDALDEAVAALDPDGTVEVRVWGAVPYLVAASRTRAIAIGPEGRLYEHDLRVPKKAGWPDLVRYAGGQLFVHYSESYRDAKGYWSGNPDDVFELEKDWGIQPLGGFTVTLPDGSVVEGGVAYAAGDRKLPATGSAISDGETFWKSEWNGERWRMREYDPRTGEPGRFSMPAFIEAYAKDGMLLDLHSSFVAPLPAAAEASPVGGANGLCGRRVRHRDYERDDASALPAREIETIDDLSRGLSWQGSLGEGGAAADPAGFVRLPGDEAPRPYSFASGWRSAGTTTVWDPSGRYPAYVVGDGARAGYADGSAVVLPPPWWHLYGYRDEAGSAALRGVDDEAAAGLLEAATADLDAASDNGAVRWTRARQVVAEVLPAITHPRLVRGVIGVIGVAASQVLRLRSLVSSRDPAKAGAGGAIPHLPDERIGPLLRNVLGGSSYWHDGSVTAQIEAVSAFFTREDRGGADSVDAPATEIDWSPLAADIGGALFLAASPSVDDEGRGALVELLEGWSRTVFAAPEAPIRWLRVRCERPPGVRENHHGARLISHAGNDYLVKPEYRYYWGGAETTWSVLEHAASGQLSLFPGVTVVDEVRLDGGARGEYLARFIAELRARGAVPWRAEIAEELAARTGLTRAEAALLWAGLPNIDDYASNFVPKPLRELLGLKVAQCSAAQETLRSLPAAARVALFAAALPDDPAALWEAPPDAEDGPVARMAAAWVARFGRRTPIPEELLVAADKELQAPLRPAQVLAMIANPESSERLTVDAAWHIDPETAELARRGGEGVAFDADALASLVVYIPYLFARLPVGDPIRAAIPRAHELALARLENDDLLFAMGSRYFWEEGGVDATTAIARFLDAHGGDELAAPLRGRDLGCAVLVECKGRDAIEWFARPARTKTAADLERLRALERTVGYWGLSPLGAFDRLRSEGVRAMVERVRDTPVPEGAYEANPLHSAPQQVRRVGEMYDLSEDAAVLYLQTLALLDPKAKSVRAWNGWKPARYKKAAAELVERELVLEAKRSRAGRAHFLPGAWEALAAPDPPIEAWKLPLYELARTEHGDVVGPLPRFVPLRPLHEIFAAAVDRIAGGDQPRYEEVEK